MEIEREILSHPQVVETAVFGVPDDILGESVVAVVVWRQCSDTSAVSTTGAVSDTGAVAAADKARTVDLKQFLKDKLAVYKQPRLIRFMSEIPRNPLGKVCICVGTCVYGMV